MINIFKKTIESSLKEKCSYYKNKYNTFDYSKINCSVNEFSVPKKCFIYTASCYCDDALASSVTNSIIIFESSKFSNRQEAEAALDIDIIKASLSFKESKFYRFKYYPEHDAIGDRIYCKNGKWYTEE